MTTSSTESDGRDPEWPTWVSAPERLVGRQEPADTSWWPGDENDGDRAAQLAARVGSPLFPWQWIALRRILSRRDDGLWTHADALLLTTRQSGKSEVLLWRMIFGLFVLGERQVYSAQRFVTSDSIFKRMKATIEQNPSLYRRLLKPPTSSSSRAVIELRNGAILQLGVRSGDLGRGESNLSLVALDEIYDLTEAEVAALTGAQLSSPNAQTIYASTPPVWEKHPNCRVLTDLRKLGQQRQPDLYFSEWGAPAGMARDDAEAWRLASPSFGVIQKERDVRRMLAKATTPTARALFDADVLGWGDFPPDDDETGAVISAETWAALASDPGAELTGPCVIGVDRSRDRKTWAIAVAQRTTTGRVHVEIAPYNLQTTTDVVDALIAIRDKYDPAQIAIDARSDATTILHDLDVAKIEPTMTSTTELVRSCGSLLDLVEGGALSHSDQQVLNDGAVSAVKRDLAGGFAWDRAPGVTYLVAASLAAWGLLAATTPKLKRTPIPMTTASDRSDRNEPVELDFLSPGRTPF